MNTNRQNEDKNPRVPEQKTLVKAQTPIDQAYLRFVKQVPYIGLEAVKDPETEALMFDGKACVLFDPYLGRQIGGILYPVNVQITDGSSPLNKAAVNVLIDNTYNTTSKGVVTQGPPWLYNPLSGNFELTRTPTVFKNVQTAANGSTAIWTAGVGKKWRLMGCIITLGQATTAAAGVKVSLLDVAADTGIGVTVSTAALAAVPNTMIILSASFLNGILAAATNTALNVNLSSAMAVNGVSVQVWGTEE